MRLPIPLLLLLPIPLLAASCNSTNVRTLGGNGARDSAADDAQDPEEEEGRTDDETNDPTTTGGGSGRGAGGRIGEGGDEREVLDFSVFSLDGADADDSGRVKVWIGRGVGCPPDPSIPPTFDSDGEVRLPWRPGVRAVLEEEDLSEGYVDIYVIFIEDSDGCWRAHYYCERIDLRDDREVPFGGELMTVRGELPWLLIGSEPPRVKGGARRQELKVYYLRR